MAPADWARFAGATVLAYLALGIPADVVANPIFGRPIPVRPIDHVLLVISAVLIGLIFGIRAPEPDDGTERRLYAGGFLSFFAIGCPVCNRLVVSLIGTSGALSWFRPIQPLLGLAAAALLVVALRRRLTDLARTSCPV